MSRQFNENTRVQVPAALHLCSLGYTYISDVTEYDPEPNTNILRKIFKESVGRLNPQLSERELENLLSDIVQKVSADDLGRSFYKMLSDKAGVKLIDFDHAENNLWHVTTEFECVHQNSEDSFRPDITCFVNGLPLAFVEVKKPNNREGILAERNRMDYRMANPHFRSFVNITQLMIFSNNQQYEENTIEPLQGAFYCTTARDKARFNFFREAVPRFVETYPYKTVSRETEHQVLTHRNCVVIRDTPEYATNRLVNTPTNSILTSMLSRERFLFLLRYGFAYVDDGGVLQKHIMRYQQMFATLAIRNTISNGGKSGIIWHTQGSGKTALAYYNIKCLTDYFSSIPTIAKFYFIVDRIDLMEQATAEFRKRGLIVRNADTRRALMDDFASTHIVENPEGKPEIMVVNVQKIDEEKSNITLSSDYSTSLQRVIFIDEAHRGYSPTGSFLANLIAADPNAIRIALTGTPLLKDEKETWRVFGGYIDTYYYDKSIADGYTLRLMREPIQTIYRERLQAILDKLAGSVKVKPTDVEHDKIIEHEQYLKELRDYILDDFRMFRIGQDDEEVGAMIVCKTNPQARTLYRLWQEQYEKDLSYARERHLLALKGELSQRDEERLNKKPVRAALILHDEGTTEERKDTIARFKNPANFHKEGLPIDVLIVDQMLLTGFDAPRLKKLYLGRKLDGHNLLQALTRVNRPYKRFKYGYVVDFVDIKENFDTTNQRYLEELNRTAGDDPDAPQPENINIADQILANQYEIEEQIEDIRNILFCYDTTNIENFRKQIDELQDKDVLYRLRNTLENARAIGNQIRAAGNEELQERISELMDGRITSYLSEVNHRIDAVNLVQNTEHKANVSEILNIALSELDFDFKHLQDEELRIEISNGLPELFAQLRTEFERNVDNTEDEFVRLSDEVRTYFRQHGFVPHNVAEAREAKGYMEQVMKKIREINRRNAILQSKYNGDARYVRIHKHITHMNINREPPLISAKEAVIAECLMKMKQCIDERIYLNEHLLANEENFRQDVTADVSKELFQLHIDAPTNDKKYIANLIVTEYTQQYKNFRMAI